MKIFGFPTSDSKPELLKQATLEINKNELRKVAEFLMRCADEIDDAQWEHEHLCDFLGYELQSDLVIFNSEKNM